jgi:polyprenyl-phospho-N-acetylgalactosaminyl synthase
MMSNIVVIIPAYNEKTSIASVVNNLKRAGFGDVVVINDGSSDGTALTASEEGCVVINHTVNMGLGAALRSGFEFAVMNDYRYVLTFDGDGQMRADDALRVYEEAKSGNPFVYGCRNFDISGTPKIRKYTNLLADVVTAVLSGRYVRDTQSGIRCIRLDLLKTFNLKCRGYSISSELIIESIRSGITPKPVKIDAIYTKESLKKGQKISNSVKVVKELLG